MSPAPGPPAPATPKPAPPPTVEQVLEHLRRLDPRDLTDRLAKARARAKALSDETTPLKTKLQSHEAELPRLALKAQLLDAVVKARGAAPAPPGIKPDGPIDTVLDQLAATDPKALADLLARMQARVKTLHDELAAIKPRITANDAELARLAQEIELLDALARAKHSMSGGAPPASPPAATNNPPASPPKAAAPSTPPPQKKASADAAHTNTPAMMQAAAANKPPAPRITFADHILPIVSARCLGCHNPDKARGGLVLDNYASAMTGGGSGRVIVPGSPDSSRLFRLVSHLEEPYMPPLASKLDDAALDTIRRWIEDGAPENARSMPAAGVQTGAAARPAAPMAAAPPRDPDAGILPTALPRIDIRASAVPLPATALAVSPAAPVVAVAGDGQILYYSTQTRAMLGALEFPEGRVEHLAFSRDGTLLAAAGGKPGQSGTVAVFEVESGRRVGQFDRLYDTVLATAISPDNGMIAVGGTNRKVRVFDLYSGSRMFEIAAHNDWVLDVQFSPDGMILATADRSGGLYCWEGDTGRDLHQLRGHVGAVTALAFRPDSQALASAGADGTIRLWEMEEGRQIRQWQAHQGTALCIAAASDQRWVSSGADGLVKLWHPDGRLIRDFDNQADWVYRVAFTPDGKHVVSGAWSGAIRIFDAATGKNPLPIPASG